MKEQPGFLDAEKFIIDDKFIFQPRRRELRRLDNGQSVILHTTASQCLLVLLSNQGRIMTRDELIAHAWGESALEFVSSNTFYQTISVLRKSLATIGCREIIMTIPRKGLVIEPNVVIHSEGRNRISVDTDEEEERCNPVKEKESITNSPVTMKKRNRSLVLLGISIAISIILVFVGYSLLFSERKDDPFASYQLYTFKQCRIYYSGPANEAFEPSLTQQFGIDCDEGSKTLFVSIDAFTRRKSVITCENLNVQQQNCHLVQVVEGVNHD